MNKELILTSLLANYGQTILTRVQLPYFKQFTNKNL